MVPTKTESVHFGVTILDLSSFDLSLSDPRHPFHLEHMEMALEEAETARQEDEVPIGAVIVSFEQGVIGRAHNQREQLTDPTAHAEMIAITQAAQALKSWRLDNCALYVTLEPCPMCAGAVVLARLPLLVYGAADLRAGGVSTVFQICENSSLNHQVEVTSGVRAEEGRQLMQAFFRERRKAGPADDARDGPDGNLTARR